jgi:predicted O-methyltransferase YrrM
MTDTYDKYKTELDAVKKYINNPYIYDIFHDYGFKLDGKFIPLDSNINVYEACFIAQLIKIYIRKYKKDQPLNVLEVGLAYGTSALVILNEIIKYKHRITYTVIDMNQTEQWKDVGYNNIIQFLKVMNNKLPIKLIQESSTIAMPKLNMSLDISFIDASHAEDIVIQDINHTDRMLVPNGLMILDDVLHEGVRKAIIRFITSTKNYRRISINGNDYLKEEKIYPVNIEKKSFTNPKTMYCFQKRK